MSDSESDEDLDWTQLVDSRVLKRGEKDHAPDGTEFQQSALTRSREAMYSVLAKPVKSTVKQLVECDWDPANQIGRVRKAKGKFFASMGWAVRDTTYLFPEEIIYLCERGSMLLYHDNEPLSIEGVLSLCLPVAGPDRLTVYAYLKKLGYVVRRDHAQGLSTAVASMESDGPQTSSLPVLSNALWFVMGSRFCQLAWRPIYLQYSSLYRDLQLVRQQPFKQYNPLTDPPGFDFLLWKPTSKFKRSMPTNADFVVRVVSANERVPSLNEFVNEFAKVSIKKSTKNSVITRMREGVRSVLFAVVDNGVVSFLRVGEPWLESA